MTGRDPRVFSIPAGVPFLPQLADAFLSGRIVPNAALNDDPLAPASATIYVPTRRAARELRAIFVERAGGRAAILPTIRPLGEFEDDLALFEAGGDVGALDLAPPIAALDRLLLLAPLVRSWKSRLPGHLASLYEEDVVVPASMADAIWFARDLAELMDEIETEGADWALLAGLVDGDLARWWQLTLEFLGIVTQHWPTILASLDRSNPAAHRNALIDAEAARLTRNPPAGPVIAAGSTGSIPATARLLAAICRLEQGAVILPGLDRTLDAAAWAKIGKPKSPASAFGHPQWALKKLLGALGVGRDDIVDLGIPDPALAARARLVAEAMRPANTTEAWAANGAMIGEALGQGALDGVTLIDAPTERDEAAAVALALRRAIETPGHVAALITGDRNLARRVACELQRHGIQADDSGGTPLVQTPPATLLRLMLEAVFTPGDPVPIVALLKHPLLRLGMERAELRGLCELIELIALRGLTGRPDIASLDRLFEEALTRAAGDRPPAWATGLTEARIDAARTTLAALTEALRPLADLRTKTTLPLADAVAATVRALEALSRDETGSVAGLYAGDAGSALADLLRALVAATASLDMTPAEWPDIAFALMAPEMVKPSVGSDPRIHIWGTLEARLQSVDTLVLGAMNEGTFPGRVTGDRFLSRLMKGEMALEPPERRIGQAAHDFTQWMGAPDIILSRSARAGDAPAVASRWLQRLTTVAGEDATQAMRERGEGLIAWARALDHAETVDFAARPEPRPPLSARPRHFSVTEIERLRRDPYAIYARKVLGLRPLDPLIRDPAAIDRGNLFHDILHAYSSQVGDRPAEAAEALLLETGRAFFDDFDLPEDIAAIWWPRFEAMTPALVEWDRGRPPGIRARLTETEAAMTEIGDTGVTLSGRADRIDDRPAGMADILDYKTGSSPSVKQAHTLVSPQLALEGALMMRGAFRELGPRQPSELAHVRLRPNGEVEEESILSIRGSDKSGPQIAEEAWDRLEKLLAHYANPAIGYKSRALPFKQSDVEGDYDHLARVLEWSAGGDAGEDGSDAS